MPDRSIPPFRRADGEPGINGLICREVLKLLVERAGLASPNWGEPERLLNRALFDGEYVVFGYSETRRERVEIKAPWERDVAFYPDLDEARDRGGRYTQVYFYLRAAIKGGRRRAAAKASPRREPKMGAEMVDGLEKALGQGLLKTGRRVSQAQAYDAMLEALDLKALDPKHRPRGMSDDSFARSTLCLDWLKAKGIYL